MQLENFIQMIIRHNAQIIESLVGLIVFTVLFLAYRSFSAAKDAELAPAGPAVSPSLGELEETLKKLLEKANAVPTPAAVAEGAGGDMAPLIDEIETLKQNLAARQAEIEKLKSAPAEAAVGTAASGATAAGLNDEMKTALDAQIKELQAKLSEYEIISEDIADLSFYKDENAKLQKELATLRDGGAPAAGAAPEPAIVGRASKTEEPMAPPVSTDGSELTPVPSEPPPVNAAAAAQVDDDIMKEFAAAVEEQESLSPSLPIAEEPMPSEVRQTPVAAAGPASAPVPEPAKETEDASTVDLGTMDIDKMAAEALNLTSNVKEDEAINALEATIDDNKLLEEAASMEAVRPEDVQLMSDFENFKKEKEKA